MRDTYKFKSAKEEAVWREAEEKKFPLEDLLVSDMVPAKILSQMKEAGFVNLPSLRTLYYWKDTGRKVKGEVTKQIIEEKLGKEVTALQFLKDVIQKATEKIDQVSIIDGIKASEIILKLCPESDPEQVQQKIAEVLGGDTGKEDSSSKG